MQFVIAEIKIRKAIEKVPSPYNHAGRKYGFAENTPFLIKERGFLLQIRRSLEILYTDPYNQG